MITNIRTAVPLDVMRNDVPDWARMFNWNVIFENPTSPYLSSAGVRVPSIFADWFPATDCELTLAATSQKDIAYAPIDLNMPQKKQSRELRLTLVDDYKTQMEQWLYTWMNALTNVSQGTTLPIKDACCKCTVIYYDSTGEKNDNFRLGIYHVFPVDTLTYNRNSSGDAVSFEASFHVAGSERELFGPPLLSALNNSL